MERISHKDLPQGFFQSVLQVQNYIDNSGLDPKLQKLIKFRVSQINSCAFCLDMHFKEALELGETPLRLFSLDAWRETPYYTPEEKAALAFAETRSGAESTLTAILGREAAMQGKEMTWNQVLSSNQVIDPKLNLAQFDKV